MSPAKAAELTQDVHFSAGPRNHILNGGQIPYVKGQYWQKDVRIFLHAVDQCRDWPAAEAVECHIKFSQWKIPLRCCR